MIVTAQKNNDTQMPTELVVLGCADGNACLMMFDPERRFSGSDYLFISMSKSCWLLLSQMAKINAERGT